MTTPDTGVVRVEISNPETLWKFAQARTGRKRRGLTARSFQLTTNDPVQEILPQSDSRVEAWIVSMTNPCWIGSNMSDVKAEGNAAAQIPTGILPVPVNTTDIVWASAATLPTTISIIAIYEQAD